MTEHKNPLVSIIVPLFNCERYIEDMIKSVISQTYENWELIIVDDGSTDSSVSIVKRMASIENRITLILRDASRTKGGDTCRNIGMDIAKGRYVIFADADDILASYCLSQRVSYMRNNPNCDFAVFPALTFNRHPLDNPDFIIGYKDDHNTLKRLINKALPFAAWNNIYRLDILKEKGITWDEKLKSNQDADFNIQCILSNLKFLFSEGLPDYHWRTVFNGKSTGQQIKSSAHFNSNIYYFNKIVNTFSHQKEYNVAIVFLALWFMNQFMTYIDEAQLNKFLSSEFFENNPLFKFRAKIIFKIKDYQFIDNPKITSWLLKLFFPIKELKRRYINGDTPFKYKRDKTIKRKLQDIANLNKMSEL